MGRLYIFTKHGQISKHDGYLIYKDCEGFVMRILPVQTDMIVLYGNISLTAEAISIMAKNQIPVTMKRFSGTNVSLCYGNRKNVFLRMSQYKICNDEGKSLEIAKCIVSGKIRNQLSFMQRIKRTSKFAEEMQQAVEKIKEVQNEVQKCLHIKSLRGLEGLASRIYFSVFKGHIFPEWAEFESRSKRPPLSNVNAVLSFLYSLLSNEISFVIESYGLDSMIGSLHELAYSRNSLTCDIMEEFRVPVADTICCQLFNNRILQVSDFEDRDGGIFLTTEGMKKTITAFEERMLEKYRKIIFHQVESYKNMIEGKSETYEPFYFK